MPAVSLGLALALLALAWSDIRRFLLPDAITLPLIAAGLAATAWVNQERLPDHLIGAAAGYAVFEAIAWAYRRYRGRDGLGGGDSKLLAAAGAWLGWQALPHVIFVGAASALFATVLLSMLRRAPLSATDRIPFGAYLCLGVWTAWVFGPIAPR